MNTVVMKLSSVEMETEEEEEDKLGHRVGFHQLNIGGDHLLAQFFNVDFSLPSEFGLGLRRVAEQGFDFRRTVIFLVDFDTDDSCLLVLADFSDSFSFPAEKRSGLFHRIHYMIEYERPLATLRTRILALFREKSENSHNFVWMSLTGNRAEFELEFSGCKRLKLTQ